MAWCWGWNNGDILDAPLTAFVSIESHYRTTCGLTPAGGLECWGDNLYGEGVPPDGDDYTAFSLGTHHGCAVRADDQTIDCWGRTSDGRTTPELGLYTAVSCGNSHTCGLHTDGDIECWGNDTFGEVSEVPPGTFIDVRVGGDFSCGQRPAGDWECWGEDDDGQVSDVP